jgi:hypothetical protein
VLLLIAQAALATAGRVHWHRQIGAAGMVYGVIVFLVGIMVSIGAPALRVRAGDLPVEVGGRVAIPSLADLLLFGVFLAFAFAYRSALKYTGNGSSRQRQPLVARPSAGC